MPPEHVEMPDAAVVGNEMYPRLENRLPAPVRRDHAGYRVDDLRAADAKALNVGSGQKPQPDPLRVHPLIILGRTLTGWRARLLAGKYDVGGVDEHAAGHGGQRGRRRL